MNRFKKELRARGVKLECDYPWLPFEESGYFLQGVRVHSDSATYSICFSGAIARHQFNRDGTISEIFDDDD